MAITINHQTNDISATSGDMTIDGSSLVTQGDTSTASMSFVIDEDNMVSNSATKVPTQQSVKAYTDASVSGLVDSAPSTLDTLNELAAALGDDANFSTTVTNSIAAKMPLAGGTFTGDVTFDGASYNVVWDKSANSLRFADNAKAVFGDGSDASIHWNGSALEFSSELGDVLIRGNNEIKLQAHTGENFFVGLSNGASTLYYDNSSKLATTTSGISVTGSATLDNNGTLLDFSRVGDAVAGQLKYVDADTGFHFGTTTNHDWYGISNDTKRFKVDNAGDVSFYDTSGNANFFWDASAASLGIGTSSPTHLLHVRNSSGNGSMSVGSSAGLEISHDNSGSTTQRIDSLYRTTSDDANLQLRTGTLTIHTGASDTERMRLKSDGTLMVGTTVNQYGLTSGGDTGMVYRAGASLDVARDNAPVVYLNRLTSDGEFIVFNKDGNDKGDISCSGDNFSFNARSSVGKAQIKTHDGNEGISLDPSGSIKFETAGAERMRLEADGDLHVDGNVIAYSTTISDERLKEDIKPIEGALDKVGQLSGYTFTYKADGKQSAGVIAQEVEAVLPSAVTESTLPLKTDDDVEYKTVQYDQLHGLLIEAIKELKAEIEELKNGSAK